LIRRRVRKIGQRKCGRLFIVWGIKN